MMAQPRGLSAIPHGFVSSTNLPSALLPRSQMKILNSMDPNTDSQGNPIVTDMPVGFKLLITAL